MRRVLLTGKVVRRDREATAVETHIDTGDGLVINERQTVPYSLAFRRAATSSVLENMLSHAAAVRGEAWAQSP